MAIIKKISRWSLLLAGIVFFLLYLNHAMARAWLAGGPPTTNAEGWLFSAGNFFSWSLASLCAGVGAFILIGKLPSHSRVASVFLVLAFAFSVFPSVREFVATDRCLDAGGKWSTLELRCLHKQSI